MRLRLTLTLMVSLVWFLGAACSATADLDQVAAATSAPEPSNPPDAAATPAPEPTATDEATSTTPSDEPTTLPGTGELPARGEPAADRIVVGSQGGQVYLIDPDGTNRLDLTEPNTGFQPVWSPDGRRIAWSQRDAAGFSIASANADGTETRRAQTLFSGYFGYWNPPSSLLGFLGNAPPGTGLVLDAGTGSDLDSVVDSDTFYYFSWNPDGTKWVVHSGSGLSIVSLDGTSTDINLPDGPFRAPTWASNNTILLVAPINGRNAIVQLDPETEEVTELIQVGDAANFVLDPTGRYLAIESFVFGENESDAGGGITVSTKSQPAGPSAEVLVYDLQTGDVRQAFDQPTGGFWWSPDGTTLAILVQEESPTPEFVQWLVWRTNESFRTERFRITPAFANAYLPFFDQFALSVTPWSPDSSRFVYSAFDQTGAPGVFVQPAQSDALPERISNDAGVAFWSPS